MRDFWGFGLLLALSCASGRAEPVVRLAAAPPPSTPARRAPATVREAPQAAPPTWAPCDVLREIVEVARQSFPSDQPPPDAAPCLEGRGGAYTFALGYVEDESSMYGPGYLGRLVLLHADAEGRIARSKAISVSSTGTYGTTYTLEGLADFDRDGVDELFLKVSEWEFEGNGDYDSAIWHVAGERVEPYGPSAKLAIARLEDIDHDGVPEALLHTPFRGIINGCGPDGTPIEFGPPWPMRAGAGGEFTFDDVSRAEVLRHCPKRPARIVPRTPGGVDNTELRERLACAVVWGVPSRSIEQELERDCPKLKTLNEECNFEGVLPVCVNVPQLVKWSAAQPPFKL
jgi:hypothetical protein